jgi:TRAP transporter 4TM/12TM fusion protein
LADTPRIRPEETIDVDDFLAQYDRESDYRRLTGVASRVISIIAICFSLFQLYTAIFGVLDAMIQRAIHLSFGMVLVFLLYPSRGSWSRTKLHLVDVVLAVVGGCLPLYIVLNYQELVLRAGTVTQMDLIVGTIGILFVLEAARRVVGMPIVVVACTFITYAFIGRHLTKLPGALKILAHKGVGLRQLVYHLYFTTEGIAGIPLGVSATFIFLFILFGAYLEKTGMGKLFIDLANAIAGWASGGPAKVAVLSSALMGTVSGSSVANVAGTGSFTIPMMKNLGYSPEFSGAVEAAASTGGQLMPPIMGAAAFLMAEFTGHPYIQVVKAAVIPAVLYYMGIWAGVHLEAKRLGLKGIPRAELPKVGPLLLEKGHLILPLAAIIYLLVTGRTPMRAALWAIFLSIVACMLRRSTRITLLDVIDGLEQGARGALSVVVACATAGVIIGVVTKTGLGLKMATTLVDIAGGRLLPTLFFTMVTSIVLGMGVPTTANYVITSTIAAPALIQMGVAVMPAHMFAFYFGIIADVTPPVALAAYAGSGIAKGDPMKTAFNASKLAIAAFLVPYMFVMSPALLLMDATLPVLIRVIASAIIGMIGIGAGIAGFLLTELTWLERLILLAGGLLMLDPGGFTDFIGLALLVGGFVIQLIKSRQAKETTAA